MKNFAALRWWLFLHDQALCFVSVHHAYKQSSGFNSVHDGGGPETTSFGCADKKEQWCAFFQRFQKEYTHWPVRTLIFVVLGVIACSLCNAFRWSWKQRLCNSKLAMEKLSCVKTVRAALYEEMGHAWTTVIKFLNSVVDQWFELARLFGQCCGTALAPST